MRSLGLRGRAPARRCLVLLAVAILAAAPAHWTASARAASPAPPALDARAAALMDADTGQLLYGANAQQEVAIASTTKLMTALIALEHVPLSTVFTEPNYYFSSVDSQIGLVPGERMSVHDLLLAMLLPSADDAALDLASGVGGGSVARFLAMMNARARQLGLTHTHYTTPIGLDTPGNYSTAADLLALARYDLRTQPFLRSAVAQPSAVLQSGDRPRSILNRNDLVIRFHWIDGVKTGHTLQAGYVLVASAHQHGMHLLSVVLGTPSEAERDLTTLALLRWGFSNFRRRTLVRAGAALARVPVRYRPRLPALAVAGGELTRVVPVGARIATRVTAARRVQGPLPRGSRVGTVTVLVDRRLSGSIPLVLATALPHISPPAGTVARLAVPITLLSVVILAAAATAVLRFAGPRRRGTGAEGRSRR